MPRKDRAGALSMDPMYLLMDQVEPGAPFQCCDNYKRARLTRHSAGPNFLDPFLFSHNPNLTGIEIIDLMYISSN